MAIKKINIQEAISDFENLSFAAYLEKYYTEERSAAWPYDWHFQWKLWMDKYINPAYDLLTATKGEMSGQTVHKGGLNLALLKDTYLLIKEEAQFPADIEKFIGFLGGHGFFEKQDLCTWLASDNWQRKKQQSAKQPGIISEIMALQQGGNFIRSSLMQLDWWKMVPPSVQSSSRKGKRTTPVEKPLLELIFDLQEVDILYCQTEATAENTSFSMVVQEKGRARIVFFDKVEKVEKMTRGHAATFSNQKGNLFPGVYRFKGKTEKPDNEIVTRHRFFVVTPAYEMEVAAAAASWSTQIPIAELTGTSYLKLMN